MIPKSLSLIGLAIATGTALSLVSRSAIAQVESNYTCFAIDETGRVINLESICGSSQIATSESSNSAASDPYQAFLDAFAEIASPESVVVASIVGNENTIVLGESICEFLATGANMDDFAAAYTGSGLPPTFVQDVSNAARDTLCTIPQPNL